MTHRTLLPILLVALLSTTAGAQADPARTARDHDLRPLIVVVPNFDDPPRLGVVDKPIVVPEPADADRDQIVENLAEWLVSLARRDESPITVTETDGTFRVTATTAQHERIGNLVAEQLDRLRVRLTAETRVLYVEAEALKLLDGALAEKLNALRLIPAAAHSVALEPAEVEQLVAAVNGDPDATLLVAPRMTVFNGQRAHVFVATDRELTTGYERDEQTGEWQAKTTTVRAGLALDLRCHLNRDDQLAVHASLQAARLLAAEEKPFEGAPGSDLKIEVPKLDAREVTGLFTARPGTTIATCPRPPVRGGDDDGKLMFVLFRVTAGE